MITMNKNDKIYIAGHRGLVGSSILRHLKSLGYDNIVTRTHAELDLLDAVAVNDFFEIEKPAYVFLAAAKVGGIAANNNYPADFIYDNIMIEANVIHAASESHVKRLLFLGSSCIYPRDCLQPIKEDYLLTGPLESTNRPYALAKISGIEMCWAYNRQYQTKFLSVMPTNLYGPGDNYDLETSHVLPAFIRKLSEAKEKQLPQVTAWGTGNPRREFLFVDDCARACVYLMNLPEDQYNSLLREDVAPVINVGCGEDISINELIQLMADVIEYDGEVIWDQSKPDGTPRKLLDVSRIKKLGWSPEISLKEGIKKTFAAYKHVGK